MLRGSCCFHILVPSLEGGRYRRHWLIIENIIFNFNNTNLNVCVQNFELSPFLKLHNLLNKLSTLYSSGQLAEHRSGRRLRDLRPSLPGRSAVAAVLHSVVHQGPTVNQQTTESSFHRRWRLCETPGIYSWHRERRIVFKCWICDGASSSHAALTCPLGDRLLVDTIVQIGKI